MHLFKSTGKSWPGSIIGDETYQHVGNMDPRFEYLCNFLLLNICNTKIPWTGNPLVHMSVDKVMNTVHF